MNKICIFIGINIGGWFGWWAGEQVGVGLVTVFLLSSLGSIVGVYLGWRINRDYLS